MNMYVLPAIGSVFKFCIVTTIFNIISVPYGSIFLWLYLMHCFVAGSSDMQSK